jgi:LacI family repressor for deo operon, udp, cdd, tsx, nupC, and nupG
MRAAANDIRFVRYLDPPQTTITQPMREIGEGCVRLLLEILRGDVLAPSSVTLPHQLTIRSNTIVPRAARAKGAR